MGLRARIKFIRGTAVSRLLNGVDIASTVVQAHRLDGVSNDWRSAELFELEAMASVKLLTACLVAIFCGIIGLAIAGGVINFSRVPFWDMWDGTVGFVLRFNSGDVADLWSQHNEHRIVLSRLLFLLDYNFLGGSGAFLIAANYLLVLGAGLAFWWALTSLHGPDFTTSVLYIYALGVLAWLSLWTQDGNLTWAFQSQFFLAQLMPLISLLLLAKSSSGKITKDGWFAAAMICGVLSVGTMANGLLVQPLMIACAVVLRLGIRRILLLVLMFMTCAIAYFRDYYSPAGHGSLIQTLFERPVELLLFTFSYLGSPFFYLAGAGAYARWIAAAAGFFLAIFTAALLFWVVAGRKRQSVVTALLLFLVYIGGTAFLTAGGRLMLGAEGAFSSRYTTPAIMAWAAVMVVASPHVLPFVLKGKTTRIAAVLLALGCSVPVLLYQLKALTLRPDVIHRQEVAALAIELSVLDRDTISTIFPSPPTAFAIGQRASQANLAVFGLEGFRDVAALMGTVSPAKPYRSCPGSLDAAESIPGITKFVRIRGWHFNEETGEPARWIEILDPQGTRVGYAIGGQPRPDVAAAIDRGALLSGFTGYLQASALSQPIQAISGGCRVNGELHPNLMLTTSETASAGAVSAVLDSEAGHGWTGSDFYRSTFEGLTVLGTFVSSDADTGRIRLRLKPGDRFLFRSGPNAGRQRVRLVDDPATQSMLPPSAEWTVLEVPQVAGVPGAQVYEFSDEGDGWGEWSAIALRPTP